VSAGRAAKLTVGELVAHLDERFPFAWAEPWDRVGLLVGDPTTEVSHVFVTLDPTAEALSLAAAHGANVLVSHHPAFLEPLGALTPRAAGVAFQAAALGIALVACHTNLDRAPGGADALPRAIGLTPGVPLERGREPVALVTVYVPDAQASAVIEAMTAAGAGRVGEYRGCSFSGLGVGSFVPGEGAHPAVGTVGERSSAEEVRIEMVCEPSAAGGVVAAARSAHPYEEPLVVVADAGIDRGEARLGRLCSLDDPVSLRVFADMIALELSVVPRVWGDPESLVTLVATLSGSGGSAIGEAVAAGASVLLTGEVRYHTALEALSAGLTVIEAGHDVTEWPHVPVLATALRAHPALAGRVVADEPTQRWWTP
jgi:dinuclear metal center YbgI/SA1388 family protein